MADQVAGLKAHNIDACAAVNGLLSLPERADVLDRVRLGDISTDELMGVAGLTAAQLRKSFADLEALGLASNDTALTAFVHAGVQRGSRERLQTAAAMETALIAELRQLAPDFGKGDAAPLNLRLACQHFKDTGFPSALPEILRRLLYSLAADGRDEDGGTGSLGLKRLDGESIHVTLQREWTALDITAERRRLAAQCLLDHLLGTLPPGTRGTDLLAETTMGKLTAALTAGLALNGKIKDPQKAIERALLWLHEQEIIRLNKGLAVFRPAMTIRLDNDWKKQFGAGDFEPLRIHYEEQVIQIHVMAEYVKVGLQKMADALRLAMDYFVLRQEDFLQRWLPGREKELHRQTTPESWQTIVESLGNKAQRDIVADPRENANVLVLAGPGSGKTRVLVHRIAYLVRCPAASWRSPITVMPRRRSASVCTC